MTSLNKRMEEWRKDFKEYVESLNLPRDDYRGIVEYIDEFPMEKNGKRTAQMTESEAIEIIECYEVNGCGYCHTGGEEVEEAFKMAVEARKGNIHRNS